MNAIIEIGGSQYRVEKSDVINVPKINGNAGDEITLGKILAVDNEGNIRFGKPYLDGSISARIIGHDRGEKVIVFKKKRRKGYRVKNGHRQDLTQIEIADISVAE